MQNEHKINSQPKIQELIDALNSEQLVDDPRQCESFLRALLSDLQALKHLIKTRKTEILRRFARRLLQAHRSAPPELTGPYRTALFEFLELARSNVVLQELRQPEQNAWFELLLTIIKASNFATGLLFLHRANRHKNKILFKTIQSGQESPFTWQQIQEKLFAVAQALFSVLPPDSHDRRVAILSENSLEMVCVDLACLMSGLVNVLIPANSVDAQVEYILKQAKPRVIFVSNEHYLATILSCRSQLDCPDHIVLLKGSGQNVADGVESLDDFLSRAKKVALKTVLEAVQRVKIDDLATIMYTSGTTQSPKGIMFSHLNIVCKRFARAIALPEIGEEDVFLCYLPLCHTFGRYFEMMGAIFWGATYVFMEGTAIEMMSANLKLVKPTVFISIPKKWIQLYEKVREGRDFETEPDEKTQAKVAEVTGGRLRWGLSAAGYLDPEIFAFFQNHGIELMSGFGMTEATGGITMTPPYQYKNNSVGKALPGIEIRLAEDGEMLIRGPYVMDGYLEQRQAGFKDGWFHTGDIFSKDEEEFYWILDRKKDIYKNIKGETIAPQKIENLFLDFETVKQVFLVGDHRPHNTLLLYPNYQYDQVDLAKLRPDELREFFKSHVVWVNRFLAPYERIVDFTVIERAFEKARGELTPKGTFKRKVVERNFKNAIEEMYQTDYVKRNVAGVQIRIPNWFLREQGLTPDDVRLRKNRLVLAGARHQLQMEHSPEAPQKIRIGSFWYSFPQDYVDFGQIISTPSLWLGNIAVAEFVGEQIFRWSQTGEEKDAEIAFIASPIASRPKTSIARKFTQSLNKKTTLQGIHYAAFMLQSANTRLATNALNYLGSIMEKDLEGFADVVLSVLKRTAQCDNTIIKRGAFKILVENTLNTRLRRVLESFLGSGCDFLDEATISQISELNLAKDQLATIFSVLNSYLARVPARMDKQSQKSVGALLDLLTLYGISHPTKFKTIRAELVKWSCYARDKNISRQAQECQAKLISSFRDWLGPNQQIAVDPETRQEYHWKDIITIDEGIPSARRLLIFNALQKKPVIREAVFLFSEGTLVRLQDIVPKGIWVSLLGDPEGKSLYRVSVQTRFHGAFDFALNLSRGLSEEKITEEIEWLIITHEQGSRVPLVKDFGGYWAEFSLWTEEFISGETIVKFLKRLNRSRENDWVERMQLMWSNFAWRGVCAYVEFWKRTGRRYEIRDAMMANVIVPRYDFQIGYRIVSISSRRAPKDASEIIWSLRSECIDAVESQFEKLKGVCGWPVIFSGFLEVLGEKPGLHFLKGILKTVEKSTNADLQELSRELNIFLEANAETGFLPRRLHFAIQRYHRWHKLNPSATAQARMQTVQELYNTYALESLEKRCPGARIQLFRDTIFAKSDPTIKNDLNKIVQNMKAKPLSEEKLLEKISELRNRTAIGAEEEFFLTRMTFPHLTPRDSAQLISLPAGGTQRTDLVVFIEDQHGNLLSIRNPASPKEIGRLHKLFNMARLPVEFRPEHHYLVVLNERLQVIGGLFYGHTEAEQAHLEKIVVDERYRRKGISDGLLNEFFNRLRGQGVKIVTVGYLRPQFFYRFGFALDRRYGNMVKRLAPETKKEPLAEVVERV